MQDLEINLKFLRNGSYYGKPTRFLFFFRQTALQRKICEKQIQIYPFPFSFVFHHKIKHKTFERVPVTIN